MAFKSSSVINLVVVGQAKHDSTTVYYFSDATTVGCFSIPLSLPPQILPVWYINIFISQQTVNKTSWSHPRQTRICYIFRLWVIDVLLKKISLYLLSHFRIRIIMLTCPDNKSAKISRNHVCLQCKITQITTMRGQYYFNWNLRSLSVCSCSCADSRVPPANLYYISIVEGLHCLKAVDRNFVRNGGTTRTHSSFCSWAGVSEQIANNVLFWLRLSKI